MDMCFTMDETACTWSVMQGVDAVHADQPATHASLVGLRLADFATSLLTFDAFETYLPSAKHFITDLRRPIH